MNSGKIILISGPSGVGKKTIIDELMKNSDLNLAYSISMTTRPKRNGEIDGVDYFFKTREEFVNAINNDELIEYETFCDNYYGTPKQAILDLINNGCNVVLEIEVKGARKIINKFDPNQLITIFIAPPSIDELKNRLIKRGTEPIELIENRINEAKNELLSQNIYNHILVNDDLNDILKKMTEIILKNK